MKVIILLIALISTRTLSDGGGHTWDYEDGGYGPDHWKDDYELCGNDVQSPIMIPRDDLLKIDGNCNQELQWNVDNTPYNWEVSHNGHSIALSSSDAGISTVTLANSFHFENNTQHSSYKLHSFHFHWGADNTEGTEHVFDSKDLTTTLEVHFVHYSADYADLTTALGVYHQLSRSNNDDEFVLAVVGVLFEEVDEESDPYNEHADEIIRLLAGADSSMNALWQNISLHGDLSFAISDLVDPSDFMENYFFYYGSLTTPPCTPAVRWHVAQNTIKIRSTTMNLFRAQASLWKSEDGYDVERNFRPLQSNPNCVVSCSRKQNDFKVCPADLEKKQKDEDEDEDEIIEELFWLWMSLSFVLGLVIGFVMLLAFGTAKSTQTPANKSSMHVVECTVGKGDQYQEQAKESLILDKIKVVENRNENKEISSAMSISTPPSSDDEV